MPISSDAAVNKDVRARRGQAFSITQKLYPSAAAAKAGTPHVDLTGLTAVVKCRSLGVNPITYVFTATIPSPATDGNVTYSASQSDMADATIVPDYSDIEIWVTGTNANRPLQVGRFMVSDSFINP